MLRERRQFHDRLIRCYMAKEIKFKWFMLKKKRQEFTVNLIGLVSDLGEA